MKLGGIQFLKKISAEGRLFLQVDNWFSGWWKQFFLYFSEISTSDSFFCLAEKYFSTKSFILASGNHFFFVEKFFLLVESITETSQRYFKRKSIFLLMKTDFLISGNFFHPFSQTAVNCCQWKQLLLQLKHIFQPILVSQFLSTGNSIILFQVLIC